MMAPTTPTESSSSTLPLPPMSLGEDYLTQECKELLPTLPSEISWTEFPFYLYHGFWFPSPHLNGLLSCQKNFRALDDDVILATMPKSGTTWLKAILFTLSWRARCSTGEDFSRRPSPLLTTNPHGLVPLLEMHSSFDDQNPDLSSFTSPRIFATHIPYGLLPRSIGDSECKIVYLCRNIKDSFTSLWHFMNKNHPKERRENALEEEFDKFCRGMSVFGPCWDHVLGYWKASLEMPERVLFLKYEDMKERPVEIVKRLAEFIGHPFDEGEDKDGAANEILRTCSLESLSNLEANKNGKSRVGLRVENKAFFRKGEVGDWVNLLSPEMADRLDRITKEKLGGSGLILL